MSGVFQDGAADQCHVPTYVTMFNKLQQIAEQCKSKLLSIWRLQLQKANQLKLKPCRLIHGHRDGNNQSQI